MKQLFKKSFILSLFVFGLVLIPNLIKTEATIAMHINGGGGGGGDGGGGGGGGGQVLPTVNIAIGLDKSIYNAGSSINISGSTQVLTCSNTASDLIVTYILRDSNGEIISSREVLLPRTTVSGGSLIALSKTTRAPNIAGNYLIEFRVDRHYVGGTVPVSTATAIIPFTVAESFVKKVTVYANNITPSLDLVGADKTVEVSWVPNFDTTSCSCEYGAPGFAKNTGTSCGGSTVQKMNTTIFSTDENDINIKYPVPQNTVFNVTCDDEEITPPPTVNPPTVDKECSFGTYSLGCDDNHWGRWGNCSSSSNVIKEMMPSLASCLSRVENYCSGNVTQSSFNDGKNAYCESLYSDNVNKPGTGSSDESRADFISYDGVYPPSYTSPVITPPPTENCIDGILNQDETGIDTGGVCGDISPCNTSGGEVCTEV